MEAEDPLTLRGSSQKKKKTTIVCKKVVHCSTDVFPCTVFASQSDALQSLVPYFLLTIVLLKRTAVTNSWESKYFGLVHGYAHSCETKN